MAIWIWVPLPAPSTPSNAMNSPADGGRLSFGTRPSGYSQAAAAKSLPGTVVFQTLPGTQIEVAGAEDLLADADGQSSLQVQLPLTLSIRARRQGFYPVEDKFYVTQELTTLELEQRRGARFAFDVYLNNMIFPGFEFSWFPMPNSLFVRGGFTTYLAGLLFSGDSEQANLFVSQTLNLIDLGAGMYLNDADRNLRAYAGSGRVSAPHDRQGLLRPGTHRAGRPAGLPGHRILAAPEAALLPGVRPAALFHQRHSAADRLLPPRAEAGGLRLLRLGRLLFPEHQVGIRWQI